MLAPGMGKNELLVFNLDSGVQEQTVTFDACLAFLIKLVEVYVIVNGGLIQADRDQYKPHGDGAFVCNCHGNPFFLFRISVCNLGIFIQELLKKDRRLPVQSLLFFVYKLFGGNSPFNIFTF